MEQVCHGSVRKLAVRMGLPAAALGLADTPLLTVCPQTCDAGHPGSGDLGVARLYSTMPAMVPLNTEERVMGIY